MARPRHPNKDIEAAVRYAERQGWSWAKATGQAWVRLRCPHAARGGCQFWVYGTPRNPGAHADRIRRQVDACPYQRRG